MVIKLKWVKNAYRNFRIQLSSTNQRTVLEIERINILSKLVLTVTLPGNVVPAHLQLSKGKRIIEHTPSD